MEPKKNCVLCGEEVEGEVHGVRLTVCCVTCCTEATADINSIGDLVTARRAKKEFGCSYKNLKLLDSRIVENQAEYGIERMRLFVTAEVKYLGERRRAMCLKNQRIKKKESNAYRKFQIDYWLGPKFRQLDAVIQHFILGDFLSEKSSKTKMKLREVKTRFAARNRVIRILQACPRAHPEAAFQFCLDHPDGGPCEFLELRDKVRDVFRLEGRRILRFAMERVPYTGEIINHLQGTVLADTFNEFMETNSAFVVHGHLMKLCDEETAKAIICHPVLRSFICEEQPEDRVAEKMIKCWEERHTRSQELQDFLNERGISFPTDSCACQDYVYGAVDNLERVPESINLEELLEQVLASFR